MSGAAEANERLPSLGSPFATQSIADPSLSQLVRLAVLVAAIEDRRTMVADRGADLDATSHVDAQQVATS